MPILYFKHSIININKNAIYHTNIIIKQISEEILSETFHKHYSVNLSKTQKILNVYAANNKVSQCIKQALIGLKEKKGKFIAQDFNTPSK